MSAWPGFGNYSHFWGFSGVPQQPIALYNIYQPSYYPFCPEFLQNQTFFSSQLKPLATSPEDSILPKNQQNPQNSISSAQLPIVQPEQRNENRNSSFQDQEQQIRKNKPTFGRGKHSSYYWNTKQHTLYCEFLKENSELFGLGTKERKNMKINVLMSRKVRTRSPIQCHTHHQKMIKKYGSIQGILQEKFGFHNQTSEEISLIQTFLTEQE